MYNVGDRVILTGRYDGIGEMVPMLGKVYTVKNVYNRGLYKLYELDGDEHNFVCMESWLSPMEEFAVTENELINILDGD